MHRTGGRDVIHHHRRGLGRHAARPALQQRRDQRQKHLAAPPATPVVPRRRGHTRNPSRLSRPGWSNAGEQQDRTRSPGMAGCRSPGAPAASPVRRATSTDAARAPTTLRSPPAGCGTSHVEGGNATVQAKRSRGRARLVVRHVTIFGHGHGLQRAIIDESQHRTPERLVMAQH